jgi:hypothetical protein
MVPEKTDDMISVQAVACLSIRQKGEDNNDEFYGISPGIIDE